MGPRGHGPSNDKNDKYQGNIQKSNVLNMAKMRAEKLCLEQSVRIPDHLYGAVLEQKL